VNPQKLSRIERAMLRAIRLKKPKVAVEWLARLAREVSPEDLVELLCYSAFTDNLATYLMQRVELMRLSNYEDRDMTDHAMMCWRLACSPKPYEWDKTQNAYLAVADAKDNAEYPTSSLLNHLSMGLVSGDPSVFGLTHELYKRDNVARKGFAETVRETMNIGFDHDLFVMWSLVSGSYMCTDESFGLPFILLASLNNELWGQEIVEFDPNDEALPFYDSLNVMGEAEFPEWSHKNDRRFGESWLSHANMALMFRQHGRLDEEVLGKIFKSKGPNWAPIVKDNGSGIFQVQSESNPREFHEVRLTEEEDSCTCPAHVFRHMKCKHILYVEKEVAVLPFRMPA